MATERLVVMTGPLKGKTYPVRGAVSIGRSPENTMQFDDLQVSRRHAVIEHKSGGAIIKDLGSGNGTYIGSRRVLEYKLSDGDVIRIGAQELRYEAGGDLVADPATKPDSGVRFLSGVAKTVEAQAAESIYATFFEASSRDSATDEALRNAQKRLKAIYQANQIISSEQNLTKLFGRVMDQIFSLVPAHNGVILLQDKATGNLVTEFVKTGSAGLEVVISKTIVNRAFDNGEAVLTFDAADDSRFEKGASIISQSIASAMCVPLVHQDERLGVIYVDTRGTANAFVSTDLELLVAFAGPSAVAIRNAQYVRQLEQSYEDTLIVLANAVELRDHYTVGHTWRVTNFAMEMAAELGWTEDKIKEVQMGGVLHDVGKIAVPDAILGKTSKLTDEEYEKIKIHPEKGAQLLQDVPWLHPLIPYALYHHERYDGRGYPYGLKGDDIPVEGRLLAVADTFDALTSSRPYRKGLDPEIAIAEIERCKESQFDPEYADALVRCYRAGRIQGILQEYHATNAKAVACPYCSTFVRFPDNAEIADEFDCSVCHRTVVLQQENEVYFGELKSRSEAITPHAGA